MKKKTNKFRNIFTYHVTFQVLNRNFLWLEIMDVSVGLGLGLALVHYLYTQGLYLTYSVTA